MALKLYLISLFSLLCYATSAQQTKSAQVDFDKYNHDFGTINEVDGPVSCTFTFTNKGELPFVINTTSVSCGCTSPEYSKAPVMPSKSGTIKVTFDPEGRPGPFDKLINILCNDTRKTITLHITGNVKPRPRTITDDYPFHLYDGVRISSRTLHMGNVARGRVTNITLGIANAGKQAANIDVSGGSLLAFISVKPQKRELAPGERSEILISVDGTKIDKWGEELFFFSLITNSKEDMEPIGGSLIFVDDVSKLTNQEMQNAPHAEFSSYFYHFSQQKQGVELSRKFTIKNTGKSDLVIRAMDATSPRILASVDKMSIAPGSEAVVTVKVDTKGVPQGRLSEAVKVITNDPNQPSRDLAVMATIVK